MKDINSSEVTARIWNNGRFDNKGPRLNTQSYDEIYKQFNGMEINTHIPELFWYFIVYSCITINLEQRGLNGLAAAVGLVSVAIPTIFAWHDFDNDQWKSIMFSFRVLFVSILFAVYTTIN